MLAYHDKEWGVPVRSDRKHFEFLILDAFQAGLSWRTVLHKRKNFRNAFNNFDYNAVANYSKRDVNRLLKDSGIIRNRQKIEAAIVNAQKLLEIRKEFGTFNKYVWGFVGGNTIVNKLRSANDYQATSTESDAMSKDMKKRGFKFCGSTICYAYMQAAGLVNDHMTSCFRYKELTS